MERFLTRKDSEYNILSHHLKNESVKFVNNEKQIPTEPGLFVINHCYSNIGRQSVKNPSQLITRA
jgi:hypothetical protein